MRKLFLAMAAVAALLASCSKDDAVIDTPTEGAETTVTFDISTPELATRYGEGNNATTLEWYVYEFDGSNYKNVEGLYGTKTFQKQTTVGIKFLMGRTYHVLFWAHADGAPYKVDPSDATMVVDYDKMEANNEDYDAFYKFHEVGLVTTATQGGTVELTRPFAQLNIATADSEDAEKAGYALDKTGIEVKVYSTMNFKTGKVGGHEVRTFKPAAKATGEITVSGTKYDIISMNYLLVNQKETPDVTLSLQEANSDETLTRVYTTVPVQRNHRTYILGNVFTKPAEFNVIIKEGFLDDHLEAWDGTTDEKISAGADDYFSVSHAAELAYILKEEKKDNIKIRLEADINFGGKELPVDTGMFRNLTIEGNGNRIFNFTRANTNSPTGLFSDVATATISNLTIDAADVDAGEGGAAYAGALFGRTYGTIKLTNVTVKNSTVAGTTKVGGLIGFVAENNVIVENCHVIDTDVTTHSVAKESGSAGGFIGCIMNSATISNSSVEGGTLSFIMENPEETPNDFAKRANSKFIGVVGNGTVELTNCSVNVGTYTNDTADCAGYVSPYGELVGGNRGTATVVIDGTLPAASSEALTETIENAADGDVIGLYAADEAYTIPHISGKSLTFVGLQEGVTVNEPVSAHNNDYYKGASLYFENLVIVGSSYTGSANGYVQAAKEEYKNCTFKNYIMFAGDEVIVDNCTFDGVKGSYFWTGSAENVTFNDCVFNGVDRAVKVCSVGNKMTDPRIVTFNGCTFNASDNPAEKAVIEIDNNASPYKVYVNNCNKTDSFTNWHNIKNTTATNKVEVYFDNVLAE